MTIGSKLELAQLWADLVSKLLGGAALLVAAWWTYTNFTVERTHDPTMEVTITPNVQPLRDKQVLLNVDVFLQNIGKVAITPAYPRVEDGSDLGLEISLIELDPMHHPSTDSNISAAAQADQDEVSWFDWTEGAGNPKKRLHKRNLLATNADFRNGRYQLNPGVRYREAFACLVERDKLYAIRARFWTAEGSVADLIYVSTYDAKSPAPLVLDEPASENPTPIVEPLAEPVEIATKSEEKNQLR